MPLLGYKLVGSPSRFRNGHGKQAKYYAQRFRLLGDPTRKIRSVTLESTDRTVARRRAVEYVERKVYEVTLSRDLQFRTQNGEIRKLLGEYVDDLLAIGNTWKQAELIKGRIERVIEQANLADYTQIDAVIVTKAIKGLQSKGQFKTISSANKYLEAFRAWTRWMLLHDRWDRDPLATARKIRGDTTNSRPRTILTQVQFERLLKVTRDQPTRRNLTGEMRFWLYLTAAQTGLRAQELHSLTPGSFHLDDQPPYLVIRNTISKRGKKTGKKDRIELQQAFAKMLRPWLDQQPLHIPLWGNSQSWWYKAAQMLRLDLQAANIPHEVQTRDGVVVVDFHSFRGLQVTNAIRTGQPSRVVLRVARLSSEKLLERYDKISAAEVTACVEAMPLPSV